MGSDTRPAEYCKSQGCNITEVAIYFKVGSATFRRWFILRPEIFKGLVFAYMGLHV